MFSRRRGLSYLVLAACAIVALPAPATGQLLPSTPLTLFGGRLVVSGSLSASVGTRDNRAYYNLSGYDTSLLRMVQVAFDASMRLTSRSQVVVGAHGLTAVDRWGWNGYPTVLHLAVQPFGGSALTVRAGIVEPSFGAFLRRSYGPGNLLIGYPLAYQYATSVRSDAFPISADELLHKRGLGAVVRYSLGDSYREPGLPLVNPFGWNAGVQVDAGTRLVRATFSLTRGGIAKRLPALADAAWNVSGRAEVQPRAGLVLGVSVARGNYVDRGWLPLAGTAAFNRDPRETAVGLDAEYSWGYWLVRAEAIFNRRTVPAFRAPYITDPLRATWLGAESRYKLLPGLYLAGRLERLSFSDVTGSTSVNTWDANVWRAEVGGGYSITRNVLGKVAYQRNSRDSRFTPRQQLVSAQVVLWF